MLDIHNDFARFMERICPMARKERHEKILAEIREQANAASLERTGGDVVIRLHGLIGRGRDEAAAVPGRDEAAAVVAGANPGNRPLIAAQASTRSSQSRAVWRQPSTSSQTSMVQVLPSSQFGAAPPTQEAEGESRWVRSRHRARGTGLYSLRCFRVGAVYVRRNRGSPALADSSARATAARNTGDAGACDGFLLPPGSGALLGLPGWRRWERPRALHRAEGTPGRPGPLFFR